VHCGLYKPRGMPTKISIALDIYLIFLYLTSITSLILEVTVNRHKVPQLIAKVSKVDEALLSNLVDNCVFRKVRLYIILQLVILTVVLGFPQCYDVYSSYDGTLWGCIVMISENVSFLVNTLETIKYQNTSVRDKY
jgi:hypothetical protein